MIPTYHILFVDDEPDLLESGKLILEETGQFSVDIQTSASAGLTLLPTADYDAIISDCQMPDMDGIEFLKRVRASGSTIPFILFTGRGCEEVVIQALNEGADFYLRRTGEPVAQFTELGHKVRQVVQRRKAELSIRDHERRESEIINFLPDATFAIDTTGVVIAWNRAMEEMTGVTAADMLGKGNYEYAIPFYNRRRPILIDLILKPDTTTAENYYKIIEKEGTFLIAETSFTHPRGKQVVLWGKASPLCDTGGKIIGAIESVRDISQRKQMEEVLRRSEEKFHALYEHMTEGAVLHDLMYSDQGVPEDYILIETNPAFEKQLGISRDTVLGKTSREAYGVTEPPYLEIYAQVALTGEPIVFETYYPPLTKHFSISAYCPYKGSFVTIFEDITERKRTEEALRNSEGRLRTLVQTIPDLIWLKDKDGVYVSCNRMFERFFGSSEADIVGKTDYDFLDREPADFFRENDRKAIAVGKATSNEEWITFADDGHRALLDTIKTPMYDARGTLIGVLGISRDITERKRAEEALRQANRKLTLLSGITRHDINNQMTTLMGFLRILEKKQPDPTLSGYFKKISIAATQISTMIQFTKEYEKIGVQAPVWQDTWALVGTAAREAGLGKVIVKNDLPAGTEVFADSLIVRVFYNLMDNAVRYGGKITTIRFSVQESGDDLMIVCEDDGEGIPPEEKEKIFERGFGRNTGIGLFLAVEILSITGITIRETGRPGNGARFEITVPNGVYRFNEQC
ncbi:MAG: PAS domain S-box protein [Methanoregula sp.]